MKRIYILFILIALYYSPKVQATTINVSNGTFDCSCSSVDYNYCTATNWIHQNLDSASAYCQTSAHIVGGGEVNAGDGFFILGDGTTTYQDIPITRIGKYRLSFQEAEHNASAGKIFLEYLDASKNVLNTISTDFSHAFSYVTEGGTGSLSGTR